MTGHHDKSPARSRLWLGHLVELVAPDTSGAILPAFKQHGRGRAVLLLRGAVKIGESALGVP